ncbi:MAG: Protein GrpE [Candidatus Heimdallarchaeota archaeon LC_3]|nr:MAG: Protein GrpE [Candidatus Heimdallarchaeota archaeon LC_3]
MPDKEKTNNTSVQTTTEDKVSSTNESNNSNQELDFSSNEKVEETIPTEELLSLEEQKELKEGIKKLTEDNKTLKDKLLRTHADYQNYRRRIQEDLNTRTELGKYQLLSNLIATLDQLFIISEKWNPDDHSNLIIVQKFFLSMQKELGAIGLKKIETLGKPVNLRYHNVVKSPKNSNNEDLIIVSEVQSGYLYKERVIRPALVELGKINENQELSDLEPSDENKK